MRGFEPARLALRRKALGMTQRKLAGHACLSAVSVPQIKNGRKDSRAGAVARFVEALERSVDYFFA